MKDLKVTTEQCILEIEQLIKENGNYAVLYDQDKYDQVDWTVVATHFKTDKIEGYGHPNKIVIEV